MPLDAQGDAAGGTLAAPATGGGGSTALHLGRGVSLGAVGDLLDTMIGRPGSSAQGGKK
jgi:hypothetical protein